MARLMFQLVWRLSTRATFWPTSSFCIWRMRCNDRLSIWPTLSIHCAMRGIACTWLHRIENKGGDEIRNSTDRYPIVHVGNIFLPELLVCESGWSESHVLQKFKIQECVFLLSSCLASAQDFVRLKMLQRFGGWFHDCDLLHLRLGPTPERAFNFHWFSSLRARPGRRGHRLNLWPFPICHLKWRIEFFLQGHNLYLMFWVSYHQRILTEYIWGTGVIF